MTKIIILLMSAFTEVNLCKLRASLIDSVQLGPGEYIQYGILAVSAIAVVVDILALIVSVAELLRKYLKNKKSDR